MTSRSLYTFYASAASAAMLSLSAVGLAQESNETGIVADYEVVDRDQARVRSEGGIVLHFGDGFSEIAAQALSNILADRGFRVELMRGGVEDRIAICLDNACWNENFDVRNSGQVLLLANEYGGSLLADRP